MTEAETLRALAARCEAMTGPDREVDGAIHDALGLPQRFYASEMTVDGAKVGWGVIARRYTASLSDAKSVIPKNALWAIIAMEDNLCRIIPSQPNGGYVGSVEIVAEARTPELATCAAALRARAAEVEARP